MTEWQEADERNNRDKMDRARQAAEALFKPMREVDDSRPPQAMGDNPGPTEHPPKRQPRIFTIPPRLPATVEAEVPTQAKPAAREPGAPRRRSAVPPSQIGRVRALATYGMTTAQVADLYGVTVEEIERVLAGPTVGHKSR